MGYRKPQEIRIPDETITSAMYLFSRNNKYILVGDNLNFLLDNINFQVLDPSLNWDIQSIIRQSLVTTFQFFESLTDRQASDAILKRVEWKYALFLPILFSGISTLNLVQFRQNLLNSSAALEEYDKFLSKMVEINFFRDLEIELPDSKTFISMICQFNRMQILRSSMRTALSMIVSLEPDWFISQIPPHWIERYRIGNSDFFPLPESVEISSKAEKLGEDVSSLLSLLKGLNSINIDTRPEIKDLNSLFRKQFYSINEHFYWRLPDCIDCICLDLSEKGGFI